MTANVDANALRKKAQEFLWPPMGKSPTHYGNPGSIVVAAEGPYITDVDGVRYIDSAASMGAATLGYNHPHVMEAMARQMSDLVQNPTGWPANVPQAELAEKIASHTPGSLKYTIFACNGTDANETAIKMARQYYKLQGKGTKHKVVGRYRNYHGMSLATLAAGGVIPRRAPFEPLPTGFLHISPPYCYRCKYPAEHPQCADFYADELRQVLEFEDPSTVACYIGEQTVAGGGVLTPPPEYMGRIRQICDENDILLIVDEVVTGFGRTGTWFECQQYDYVPDIIAMAKGITSGHAPLAATHVREEIAQAFFAGPDSAFQHAYTFGGMAVSCAAAVATMEFIEETDLLAKIPQKSAAFQQELERIMEKSPVVGDVRSHGMLFGMELVKNKETKEVWDASERDELARIIAATGQKHGVIMLPQTRGLGTLVIYLAPPLNIGDGELETIANAVEASVREVERTGT